MALLDKRAILLGAIVAIAVALPAAVIGQVVVEDENDNLAFLFFALVLFAFAAGGYAAARHAPDAPYSNGALAAVLAFVFIQGLGAIRRAIIDDPVALGEVLFALLLALPAGVLGGVVAERKR